MQVIDKLHLDEFTFHTDYMYVYFVCLFVLTKLLCLHFVPPYSTVNMEKQNAMN